MNRERLKNALKMSYSKEICYRLYKKYFLDWIAEGYLKTELNLFEISMISEATNIDFFLNLLEEIYTDETVFKQIFNTFSDEIKECFIEIAWNGKKRIENKEIFFNQLDSYNSNLKLKDEFLFFKRVDLGKKGSYLTLDIEIIKYIRVFLEKPKDYNIIPIKDIESAYIENNEIRIQENISKYFSFFSDGKLQLTSSGKLFKESKINLKKYCNIHEYYEGIKDLEFIKTEIMGLFIFLFKDEYLNEEFFKSTNLKAIVEEFLNGEAINSEDSRYINLYLNYLKGIKNIELEKIKIKDGLRAIRRLIEEFPEDSYISIENIVKALTYRDEAIEIIDIESALSTLYINEANYERSKIVGYDKYIEYIVVPFIKSVFFILASLGVVEIAYEKPEAAKSLFLKSGYLNKYNGIKYVKFTELGKYVFGKKESYSFKEIEDTKVEFDEETLILTLIGESPIKKAFLEKIATKITSNRYKFTEESFLKGINSSEELKNRVKELENKLGEEYPTVWKQFFENILKRTESIKKECDYEVFKLKSEEIKEVILKDSRFNDLLLRAEDYHIIVKRENVEKLKEIFGKYGYFIEF